MLSIGQGEHLASKKALWAVLKLTPLAGTPNLAEPETNVTPDIAQGLVVLEQEGGVRLSIGRPTDATVRRFGVPQAARPSLALTVFIGPSGKAPKVERCELSVPGAAPLVADMGSSGLMVGDPCDSKVQVQRLERTRSGEVKLTFDGVIGASPRGYEVHFDFATFVRDVITARALVAAEGPALPRERQPLPSDAAAH